MKINILFVDDDNFILENFKVQFQSLDNDWNIFLSDSGFKALEIMESNKIDVVVTDLVMPEMDGIELLKRVKEKYPYSLRIVLSSHNDKEKALKSSQFAHQLLSKPFDPETVKAKIDKTFFLRSYLQNEKLLNLITGMNNLPTLPEIYIRLEEEIQNPDISMQKVSDIIAQDISMTAKILQLVNSGFFGLPNKISSTHQAVNLLGTNIIKTLVLYIQIFTSSKHPRSSEFSLEMLWHHSIKVAFASREIMKSRTKDKQLIDDAYVAGVLHDIGKLILLDIPDYEKRRNALMASKDYSQTKAEYAMFETTHAEVGAYLLGVWGLPYTVVEAVAFHHSPSMIEENEFTPLTAVHLANSFVHFAPYIDLKHVKTINLQNSLLEFLEICMKV